jgi:hypothetical protein
MWKVIVLVLLDNSCGESMGVIRLSSALFGLIQTYLEELGRSMPDLPT